MTAMAEPLRKAKSVQEELDLFLSAELPPQVKNFPIWWLAKFWHTSVQHICKLIEKGDIECPIDLRTSGSSRAEVRIPRPFVIAFIEKRRDVQAVAESNPIARWNPKSRRKSKKKKGKKS